MLTEVTGACEPFTDDWLNILDKMPKEQALRWVRNHLEATISFRNSYEAQILSKDSIVDAVVHAWCIENNNIVRFKRLLDQIIMED